MLLLIVVAHPLCWSVVMLLPESCRAVRIAVLVLVVVLAFAIGELVDPR